MGRRQRRDLGGALRGAAREGDRAHRRRRRPLRRRRVRGRRSGTSDRRPRRHGLPVPRALRADDVHRPDRGRAARLRAAGARPARARARVRSRGRRHPQRHVRRPASVAPGGADRRHLLCGRDQEVDLHADERPPAARGRLPDALLGERRRRRRCRDLLRALRHGQDDALRRPRAQADRRRRARLGRQRRLQLRGRLLREGDPPLRRGRARDLQDDAHVTGRSSRTSSSTSAATSTSTTARRPRTRVPRTSSSRSRTRSRPSAPATRSR